nr:MAG TPA: hypothetical protein [Caudoviricetes sp.]
MKTGNHGLISPISISLSSSASRNARKGVH